MSARGLAAEADASVGPCRTSKERRNMLQRWQALSAADSRELQAATIGTAQQLAQQRCGGRPSQQGCSMAPSITLQPWT